MSICKRMLVAGKNAAGRRQQTQLAHQRVLRQPWKQANDRAAIEHQQRAAGAVEVPQREDVLQAGQQAAAHCDSAGRTGMSGAGSDQPYHMAHPQRSAESVRVVAGAHLCKDAAGRRLGCGRAGDEAKRPGADEPQAPGGRRRRKRPGRWAGSRLGRWAGSRLGRWPRAGLGWRTCARLGRRRRARPGRAELQHVGPAREATLLVHTHHRHVVLQQGISWSGVRGTARVPMASSPDRHSHSSKLALAARASSRGCSPGASPGTADVQLPHQRV